MEDPAALLHGFEWSCDESTIQIAPGVKLGRVADSYVGRIYKQLCRSRHVDGGDPLMFDVFLSIADGSQENNQNIHFADPFNAFCRVANLLVVASSYPVGAARMIWPKQTGWRGHATASMWSIAEWTWPLEGGGPWMRVTPQVVSVLETMWAHTTGNKSRSEDFDSRLNTALTYFQHSWRSQHIEPACLHLSVALEVLFAPHSQAETTHQIAFNVSHFMASHAGEREVIYDTTRRFYGVRSAIIHGGTIDFRKVEPAVVDMFRLLAGALRKILGDRSCVAVFESEKHRKALFRSFLFA